MSAAALVAALILIIAPAGASSSPAGASRLDLAVRYTIASGISARITRDSLAYAEAARIAADTAAELAAAQRAQSEAQATVSSAQTAAGGSEGTAAAGPVTNRRAAGPAPIPTVVVRSSPASPLRQVLAASSWPAELWPTVERIVECESRGQTTAVSPGGHVGLMQVDSRFWGPVPADALGQLEQGWVVYQRQGWGAWQCY